MAMDVTEDPETRVVRKDKKRNVSYAAFACHEA